MLSIVFTGRKSSYNVARIESVTSTNCNLYTFATDISYLYSERQSDYDGGHAWIDVRSCVVFSI